MSTPIWSTFSGIGGLELGREMAGLGPVVLQCEFEEWNRALLAERWPGVTQHADIRTLEAKHGQAPVILCGGFPCQDLSLAGARQGFDGTKSALWWEMARVLAETRPPFAVFENVAAILSDVRPVVPPRADWLGDAPAEPFLGAFSAVLWTLAALGYDATWDCVPAGALGAPHRRDRWFLVAYSRSIQPQRHGAAGQVAGAQGARGSEGTERKWVWDAAGCSGSGMAYSRSSGLEGHHTKPGTGGPQLAQPPASGIWRRAIERARAEAPWTYLPRVGGTADGVPGGVDRPCQPWEQGEARTKPHQAHWKQRLRGLGNACLPLAAMVPGLVVRELMDWGAP